MDNLFAGEKATIKVTSSLHNKKVNNSIDDIIKCYKEVIDSVVKKYQKNPKIKKDAEQFVEKNLIFLKQFYSATEYKKDFESKIIKVFPDLEYLFQ